MLKKDEYIIPHSQFVAKNIAINALFSGRIEEKSGHFARVKHLTNSTYGYREKHVFNGIILTIDRMRSLRCCTNDGQRSWMSYRKLGWEVSG